MRGRIKLGGVARWFLDRDMSPYSDEEIINIVWNAKVGEPLPQGLENDDWCHVFQKYGAPITIGMSYDECFVRAQNFLSEIRNGVSGV